MKPLMRLVLLSFSFMLIACQDTTNLSTGVKKTESNFQNSDGTPVSLGSVPPTNLNLITGNEVDFIAIINDGYTESMIMQNLPALGIQIKFYLPRFRMLAFSATSSQIEDLKFSPFIKSIQADVKVLMQLSTTTTQIRSRNVRDTGVEGRGARVCIIDSGMNYHSELPMPESEKDFVDNDNRADDIHGHGTAVAGIIASQDPDLAFVKGNSGVAPEATLLIAKVFGAAGTASASSIAQALDWCASENAHIINMSLGHGGFTSSCDTDFTALFSNQTADQGIVVVAASGNDGFTDKVSSPACGSKVMGVGSVNKQDMKSSFSNAGSEVDISAPGENVITTNFNGGFSPFSGTSAATPFVAGVAALLKSMPENPSAQKIKDALLNGAKDLGAAGKDHQYGKGRVDAYKSYEIIKNAGSGGGLVGGTNGGTSGGSTGGSTGGSSGGTSGGSTGGTPPEDMTPTKFTFGMVSTSNEGRSSSYSSSQMQIQEDCPKDHYLTDLQVQGARWFLFPSITWMKLECQSFKTLNTSVEFGMKKGGSVASNFCADKKAITGLEIKTGSNIKDIRTECSTVSYDEKKVGAVNLSGSSFSSYGLGRGFLFDKKTTLKCPQGSVAIGVEGSAKTDSDEWAFTRLKLRCAAISTAK